jgi:hypothetical protein
MMQVTEEQVKEYMSIYLKRHGVPIDMRKANDELTALLFLLQSVHTHIERENSRNTQ